ncbi:MAG: TraM recognition domain-containing protein [Bacteroidetes bacterium]|nr:TraM recognition domain-containing protein [Bacteroidota bacterium]
MVASTEMPGDDPGASDSRPTSMDRLLEINRQGTPKALWPGRTVFGFGARMNVEPIEEGLIDMADADRAGHVGCLGTTRCGKSRLIEAVMEQDIRKNYSVVVFDPKGDQELFSKFVQVAAECGRLEDVMMLTPIFPDYSVYLDPLSDYFMEEELVNHIYSILPGKDSPQAEFFTGTAESVGHSIISALTRLSRARGERVPLTFDDIKKRIGHDDLKRLSESLSMLPNTEDLRHTIDSFTSNPALQDYYTKISGSLRDGMLKLTMGNTGRIIGKARTNPFIQRLERGQRVLFFCTLGSMLTSRVSYVVAKVFVSMIQSLAGRMFARGSKLAVPLCLHLDEGHNVLYPGIHELFAKAGGANIWVHLYTQSKAQIEREAGHLSAQSIIDSINTWTYFRLNHPETAHHVQETSPVVDRQEAVISLGAGVTFRGMKQRQIQQDKVISLPDRCFYFRGREMECKGQTLDVYPPYVRVKFPHVTNEGSLSGVIPPST